MVKFIIPRTRKCQFKLICVFLSWLTSCILATYNEEGKIFLNFNKYLFGKFKNKIYLCTRNKEEEILTS